MVNMEEKELRKKIVEIKNKSIQLKENEEERFSYLKTSLEELKDENTIDPQPYFEDIVVPFYVELLNSIKGGLKNCINYNASRFHMTAAYLKRIIDLEKTFNQVEENILFNQLSKDYENTDIEGKIILKIYSKNYFNCKKSYERECKFQKIKSQKEIKS